jgi:phosphatidylserine decarboxylase
MTHTGKAQKAAIRLILFTLGAVLGLIVLGWIAYLIGGVLAVLAEALGALWLFFAAFTLYFFRDPDPIEPSDLAVIVSPAHGTVDAIDETVELEVMGGPCQRISIFLSLFDVHVQNAPVYGTVHHLKHSLGLFLSALKAESALHNENVLIGFTPVLQPANKVAVRLIAGLLTRRISCWAAAGDLVPRSQRISLIHFGSRVDLFLPLGAKIKISTGDHVIAGQSVVATFS